MSQQKIIGKFKFFMHMCLSFIVWNIIILFLFEIISGIILKLLPNNLNLYIIIFNLLWMISSFVQIILTYYFNRKHTVLKQQLQAARRTNLFMFYIGILFINFQKIFAFIELNMLISTVLILLHIIVIWKANEKIFNHFFEEV